MSFKSFLKAAGEDIAKVFKVGVSLAPLASTVAGVVSAADPTNKTAASVSTEIGQIGGILVNTEAAFQLANSDPNAKTGAQKLAQAAPLVEQVILSSPLLAGKKIADDAKFKAAIANATSAFADILNSLEAPAAPAPAVIGSTVVTTTIPASGGSAQTSVPA